jgi:hypothetical protein
VPDTNCFQFDGSILAWYIDSGFGKMADSFDEVFARRHEGKKLVFIG